MFQVKPSWLIDEEDIDEDSVQVKNEPSGPGSRSGDEGNPLDDVTRENAATNPDEEDMDPSRVPDDENTLEGSVTEEDPPENMFGDDDDEEIVGTAEHEPAPDKSEDPIEENQEEEELEPAHEEMEHEGGDAVHEADFQSHEQVTRFFIFDFLETFISCCLKNNSDNHCCESKIYHNHLNDLILG